MYSKLEETLHAIKEDSKAVCDEKISLAGWCFVISNTKMFYKLQLVIVNELLKTKAVDFIRSQKC